MPKKTKYMRFLSWCIAWICMLEKNIAHVRRSSLISAWISSRIYFEVSVGYVVHGMGKQTQENHLSVIDTPIYQYINHIGHEPVSYLVLTPKIYNDIPCPFAGGFASPVWLQPVWEKPSMRVAISVCQRRIRHHCETRIWENRRGRQENSSAEPWSLIQQ